VIVEDDNTLMSLDVASDKNLVDDVFLVVFFGSTIQCLQHAQ
jgi:hypothetical protein